MKLVVTDDIFEAFPDVHIGVLVLSDVDNTSGSELESALREAQERTRTTLTGANITEHPRIRCWREAYRTFGAKPKKYPSSIENLVRRTLKGEDVRSINPLVDLYNVVSLNHLIPVGGEDLDHVEGALRLTRASENEPAVRLLGEAEERPPKAGEVIYTDDLGAVCRRWNWKEADRTKLTEKTKNAVLVLEALPPTSRDELQQAMIELEELVQKHTGAQIKEAILSTQTRELKTED